MNVGAVVVTYRRPQVLASTLRAIRSQSVPPNSIIVVDNDADHELEAWLASTMPDVAYAAPAENVGFSAALCCGMRWLRDKHDPDWFWLLDDDSPPSARYLSDALDVAQQEPRPWVIANRGGRMVHGLLRYGFDGDEQTNRASFALLDGTLIARAAVEVAGYPREDLFMMFEDIEYTTRIAALGGTLIVNR